jgi:hypothetical protein
MAKIVKALANYIKQPKDFHSHSHGARSQFLCICVNWFDVKKDEKTTENRANLQSVFFPKMSGEFEIVYDW